VNEQKCLYLGMEKYSDLNVSMYNASIRVCVKKPQDRGTIPEDLDSCWP
jgi:hypothetical protein